MKKTDDAAGRPAGSFVYMLRCRDGSLYTGWTTDVQRRLRMHNSGQGAKYTRSRGPVELVYVEEAASREEALRREAAIKKLRRAEKLALLTAAANQAARYAQDAQGGQGVIDAQSAEHDALSAQGTQGAIHDAQSAQNEDEEHDNSNH